MARPSAMGRGERLRTGDLRYTRKDSILFTVCQMVFYSTWIVLTKSSRSFAAKANYFNDLEYWTAKDRKGSDHFGKAKTAECGITARNGCATTPRRFRRRVGGAGFSRRPEATMVDRSSETGSRPRERQIPRKARNDNDWGLGGRGAEAKDQRWRPKGASRRWPSRRVARGSAECSPSRLPSKLGQAG